MIKQKIVNWGIFLTVICCSCSNPESQLSHKPKIQELKEKLIGSWGGGVQNEYAELHFVDDSVYIPIQDSVYFYIPYSYSWINEDTIQLSPFYYKYKVSIDGDTLRLSGKNELFQYDRIKPEPLSLSIDFYNGFVIRRCNFLATKGVIRMQEAYEQLYEYIKEYNILDTRNCNVEEEYIFPTKD